MKINKLNFKKGDVSMSMVIMAVLAITVLLVVIVIFVKNMKKPTDEMSGISDSVSLTDCGDGTKSITDGITGKTYKCEETEQACLGTPGQSVSLMRSADCKKSLPSETTDARKNYVCCIIA